MKSASERFGLPSAMSSCWRSMLNRVSIVASIRHRPCRPRCRRRRASPARIRRRRAAVSSRSSTIRLEQLLRMLVELARGRAVLRMIEDRRESSLQLPRGEEERPVDERDDVFERHVVQQPRAGERRRRDRVRPPVESAAGWRAPPATSAAAATRARRAARGVAPDRRALPASKSGRCAAEQAARRHPPRATHRARARPAGCTPARS